MGLDLEGANEVLSSTNLANLKNKILDLNGIPLLGMEQLPIDIKKASLSFLLPEIEKEKLRVNYLSIFTGLNNWDFQLNDNYNSALSPADFSHTKGKGYFLGLAYKRALSKRIKLETEIQYEHIVLQSGHNSQFTYELGNETDRQNETELTMATPLGFVTSPVVINRLVANTSTSDSDLSLDLSNRHTLKNLDLGARISYTAFSFKGIEIEILIGGGWNRILDIKNELYQVETGDAEFKAIGSDLVSDPAHLNRNRFYYSIGSALNKKISTNNHVALSYQLKRDLSSIYTEDDFNTRLIRHNLSLALLRKF